MIVPVILSGGSGTRLWPLSRAKYPKQFIRFFDGDDGRSLLGATLRRLDQNRGFAAPLVLCGDDHRFLVRDELARAGVTPLATILEPVARNTGPAIAVAALAAERRDADSIIAVMPSDHIIRDECIFVEAIERAAAIATSGKLVLFGVTPTEPHTGYGYIRKGDPLDGACDGFAVETFLEKPDRTTAESYLGDGGYLWNTGIFLLPVQAFLDELARYAPDVLESAKRSLENADEDLGFLRLDRDAFATSPNISIDYALIEKTGAAAVLPLEVGWSDVGSWSSLWEVSPHDDAGNAVAGEALLVDTHGCYVHSERSLVSTIGLRDLVIVDTPDALLVADRARAQDVSGLVAVLKQKNRKEHAQHLRDYRPWGYFETLSLGERFQVKLLHVAIGGKLSLQMHHHRSEHWVVVRGTAKVIIGDTEKLIRENESVYITATRWHRLENPGKVPLEMIEVQIGSYLGEDDIVRSDDIYRRDRQ